MSNIAIAFVLLIPVWFGIMLVFDRLVRLEYQEYRTQWEQDGQPRGVFWTPPEASQKAAPFFSWLFSTPNGRARISKPAGSCGCSVSCFWSGTWAYSALFCSQSCLT
jgi:hypothetical protein